MQSPKPRVSPLVPLVLAGATAVSVLSTDLFTPSIPDLPEIFGTDIETAQRAVTINLFAYAVAHLFHGPLADAIGRRALFLSAFILFIAASIFCATAVSMESLLVGRFLQGLFSSVPSVVIILIIRELYDKEASIRVLALYGAVLGLAPALGPIIGGYLHIWFGWTAAFWTIAILAMLVLALFALLVPESLAAKRPLNTRQAASDYLTLMRRAAYVRTLLPQSLIFGGFFAYVTTAPVVFIDLLGVPTERYGLTYAIVIAAYVGGTIVCERLSKRVGAMPLFRTSLAFAAVSAVCLAGPSLAGLDNAALILAGMVPFAIGLGMVLVAGPLVLLDTVGDLPQGPASALLGTAQLGSAAIASWISSEFYNGSSLSMTLTTAGCCLTAGAIFLLWRPRKRTAAAE